MNAITLIGNTTLFRLERMVAADSASVFLKLEYENPTGSMKDRMALAMVDAAERDGRLKPGGSVVEYTGGSTGVSLAFVCAVKGIPLKIVTSVAVSSEKRAHMAALGAEITLVEAPGGLITRELVQRMIATARDMASAPGSFWTDQFNNRDQVSAYTRMADEIWEQSGGRVTTFVQSVGTCGSLRGNSTRLRQHDPSVRVIAVEPAESAVLSGGPSGPHRIEGTGPGFVMPHWDPSLASEVQSVSSADAMAMARRLAREEGIFAGTSTGANVAVALREAARLGPGASVVTIACDSGMKYLSTEQYRG